MCDTSEKICIGFIGLGLIGGSIAKTLRKVHPEYKLMAYCRTKATIEEAIQEGVIDIALEERDDRFADCDYIFLCAPVSTNISYLPFVKGIAKPGCIITDVGSVKGEIHQAVETLGMTHQFIGGHPMAGSEKTGYSSATDYLLENAYYMITPGPDVEIATVSAFVDLVQSLKAIPMVLTYEEHDYITAGVSHLPHIVAATLVNALASLDTPEEQMKTVAAGGFKDITRIASSSPEVWQQICLTNTENISTLLSVSQTRSSSRMCWIPISAFSSRQNTWLTTKKATSSTICLKVPANTGIPWKILPMDRQRKNTSFTATCSMKPAESQPLQQFLPSTRSILKISALRITASSKRVLSALNFMKSRQAFLPGRS